MAEPTTSIILDGWEMQVLTTLIDGPCSGVPGHEGRIKMELLREKLIAARGRLVESGAFQPASNPEKEPPPAAAESAPKPAPTKPQKRKAAP